MAPARMTRTNSAYHCAALFQSKSDRWFAKMKTGADHRKWHKINNQISFKHCQKFTIFVFVVLQLFVLNRPKQSFKLHVGLHISFWHGPNAFSVENWFCDVRDVMTINCSAAVLWHGTRPLTLQQFSGEIQETNTYPYAIWSSNFAM